MSRRVAIGNNSISTSTVLVLRPRPDDAAAVDLQGFLAELRRDLPGELAALQSAGVAPVDLPQAAIGPGMSVFTRFRAVFGVDGSALSVQDALARINEVVDQVYAEQEGDFDRVTRFAISWYRQHGYDVGLFGDANNLAQARDISVEEMDRHGIVRSRANRVQLLKPEDLDCDYDPLADTRTSAWEVLHQLIRILENDGIGPAGSFLQAVLVKPVNAVDPDLLKELGHLLFRVAEGNGWTKDALSFNSVVTTWPEVRSVVASDSTVGAATQDTLNFTEED